MEQEEGFSCHLNYKNIELSEPSCAAHREEGGNKCLTRRKHLAECQWVLLNTLKYSHSYWHTCRIIKWVHGPLTAIFLLPRILLQIEVFISIMRTSWLNTGHSSLHRLIWSFAGANFSACLRFYLKPCWVCSSSGTSKIKGNWPCIQSFKWALIFIWMCSEHPQEPPDLSCPLQQHNSFPLSSIPGAGDSHGDPDFSWSNSSLLQTW